MKVSLFSVHSKEYAQFISGQLGKGAIHAELIYKEFFKYGKISGHHPAFNNAKKLFEQILAFTDTNPLTCSKKQAQGDTQKFLLVTQDQLEIESVILPMKSGWTLCISSQIGCKMGCSFCETAKMGLLRNLEVGEIVNQVFWAKHILGYPIRNIVFMGMGEPLDNFENVAKAIDIFCDADGLGFGPSHITVSTSGLIPELYAFMQKIDPAINLAISLHGSNDKIRERLMPVNKKHPLGPLKEMMQNYCKNPRRKIFIEYIMIDRLNDQLSDAHELAEYLNRLNVTINLIPCNPQTRGTFKASSREAIDQFSKVLKEKGFRVFVRTTQGENIMAACGQLGNRQLRKSLYSRLT